MKSTVLIITIVAGLMLTGCAQPAAPATEPAVEPASEAASEPAAEMLEPPPELYHQNWISPGKVVVGNFYPGARAEWLLTILCCRP